MIYDNSGDLSDLPQVVRQAICDLTPHAGEFDSIAVTGVSGILVGAPVAIAMGKPLIVIRKEHKCEHRHSHRLCENIARIGKRYLFLDDFISSGETFRRLRNTIAGQPGGDTARCAGTYKYMKYSSGYDTYQP